MARDFSDKVVVVTGGSRGIGKSIALGFGQARAKVAINYVSNGAEAEKTLNEMTSLGIKSQAYQADVSNSSDVEGMFKQIAADLGPVDVLVNNAGILRRSFVMMMQSTEFQQLMNINVLGVFNCTKFALRYMMRSKRGSIINMSSLAGHRGLIGQSAYAASKAAVNSLTEVAAKEMATYGIRVNGVAPGCIDTGMMKAFSDSPQPEYLKNIPLKRYGDADEVTRAVMFLASDDASYITGETLTVDGGMNI